MDPFESDSSIHESFGDYLKKRREASGKTLDALSKTTRIPKRYLQAFEENDSSRLPEEAFSRGFLKVYAAEVGLDAEECLMRYERFKRSLMPTQIKEVKKPGKTMLLGEDSEGAPGQSWFSWGLAVGVFVAALCVGLIWLMRPAAEDEIEPIQDEIAEVQEGDVLTEEGEAAAVPVAPKPAPAIPSPVTPSMLTVSAVKAGTLQIRLDENPVQEIHLKEGETQTLSVFREVEIRSIDKNLFKFQYNGKPLEVSGPVIKLFNKNLFTKKP